MGVFLQNTIHWKRQFLRRLDLPYITRLRAHSNPDLFATGLQYSFKIPGTFGAPKLRQWAESLGILTPQDSLEDKVVLSNLIRKRCMQSDQDEVILKYAELRLFFTDVFPSTSKRSRSGTLIRNPSRNPPPPFNLGPAIEANDFTVSQNEESKRNMETLGRNLMAIFRTEQAESDSRFDLKRSKLSSTVSVVQKDVSSLKTDFSTLHSSVDKITESV